MYSCKTLGTVSCPTGYKCECLHDLQTVSSWQLNPALWHGMHHSLFPQNTSCDHTLYTQYFFDYCSWPTASQWTSFTSFWTRHTNEKDFTNARCVHAEHVWLVNGNRTFYNTMTVSSLRSRLCWNSRGDSVLSSSSPLLSKSVTFSALKYIAHTGFTVWHCFEWRASWLHFVPWQLVERHLLVASRQPVARG